MRVFGFADVRSRAAVLAGSRAAVFFAGEFAASTDLRGRGMGEQMVRIPSGGTRQRACDPSLEERDWNASHGNVMLGRVCLRANVAARVQNDETRRSLRDEEDR